MGIIEHYFYKTKWDFMNITFWKILPMDNKPKWWVWILTTILTIGVIGLFIPIYNLLFTETVQILSDGTQVIIRGGGEHIQSTMVITTAILIVVCLAVAFIAKKRTLKGVK
jgi:hypothetical protein